MTDRPTKLEALELFHKAMTESPFPRQPETVYVMLAGDPRDVDYYCILIAQAVKNRSDDVSISPACRGLLTIYPRAVNE